MSDNTTNISIIEVEPESRYLKEVVSLADANSKYLGHYPASCFKRDAGNQRLIGAIANSNLKGFVLYRTTKARAVIQMLCVGSDARKQGIARLLIKHLRERTAHLPSIICHCAQEYTDSLAAWTKLGFLPEGEKIGRGKSARPLIRLALHNDNAHLFAEVFASQSAKTIAVGVDMNVAILLGDADCSDRDILAMRSGWIIEEVQYHIGSESHTEAIRQEDATKRKARLAQLTSLPKFDRDPDRERHITERLTAVLGPGRKPQDKSDQLQIAQAIVGEAAVFVTRDQRILSFKNAIATIFNLQIMDPAQFVSSIDMLLNAAEYAPARLQGTKIEYRRPASNDLQSIVDEFLNMGRGEKKHEMRRVVNEAAVDRAAMLHEIYSLDNTDVAWIATQRELKIDRCLRIRVKQTKHTETLTRHFIRRLIDNACKEHKDALTIEDSFALSPIDDSARALGFIKSDSKWIKLLNYNLQTRRTLIESPSVEMYLPNLRLELSSHSTDDSELEKIFWPAKVRSANLLNYIVPIRPAYAMHLIDQRLSSENLFGGDYSTLLSDENVYFRSAYAVILKSPSRVLWYVSRDKQSIVQSIRACSSVLGVYKDSAKQLYRRFRDIATYSWNDVRNTAGGDPDADVSAIHFARTETLPYPVPGDLIREIIVKHKGTSEPPPLSMPVEICNATFEEIYARASTL